MVKGNVGAMYAMISAGMVKTRPALSSSMKIGMSSASKGTI